jgi:hypothetical protein
MVTSGGVFIEECGGGRVRMYFLAFELENIFEERNTYLIACGQVASGAVLCPDSAPDRTHRT